MAQLFFKTLKISGMIPVLLIHPGISAGYWRLREIKYYFVDCMPHNRTDLLVSCYKTPSSVYTNIIKYPLIVILLYYSIGSTFKNWFDEFCQLDVHLLYYGYEKGRMIDENPIRGPIACKVNFRLTCRVLQQNDDKRNKNKLSEKYEQWL